MRWTITKLFDSAKARATDAGQQLNDAITYLAEFCELTGRSLRSGLTFRDNFDCDQRVIGLQHDLEQIILVPGNKAVTGIDVLRTVPQQGATLVMLDGFGWQYNQNGEVVVKARFVGSPTVIIDTTVVIYF